MAYIDGKEILFSARVTGGGGAEIVNTLAGDEADKAPSVKAVNEGLAEKQDKLPFDTYKTTRAVYGRDKYGTIIEIPSAGYGNYSGHLVQYASVSVEEKSDSKGTITVTEPRFALQAANKQYVDDSIADITSQLGSCIKTDTVYGDRGYGGYPVPDNAYPTVYFSDPSFAAINADGETAYVGRATKLIFRDLNGGVLGYEDIEDYTNPSCFVVLPEGTKTIAFNIEELTDGIWDGTTLHYWGYALFQVKGGV